MRPETLEYLRKNPCARTSSIIYREKRAAMTERLKRETVLTRKPLWRRILDAIIRGWGAV